MRKRKRLCSALLAVVAMIIMALPVSEADAASSASDFVIEGSTLVKYTGKEKNVTVPDTVEIIGESAFENQSSVEKVTLPASVKRIDAYAFWNCNNLSTVTLGKGLTEIGEYAFAGCTGLKEMTIPSNVTSIGAQAFGDCTNFESIMIPVETVQIAEDAFEGCARLTIHATEGSVAWNYARSFYEKQKSMPGYDSSQTPAATPVPTVTLQPAASPQPTVTPSPAQSTGKLVGSSNVVGNRAVILTNASGLETLDGSQVSEASGDSGSSENSQDTSWKNAATSIAKYTIVDGKTVADQAYYKSRALEQVSLPGGITEIGEFSFARSSIRKVVIPEGTVKIGYGAFYHCDELDEVQLPSTIETVEPKAFEKSAWVERFRNSSGDAFLISGEVLVAYKGNTSVVTIPDGVRVIGAEVFARHSEIEEVIFPASLRIIGEAAFEDCTGIRKVQCNAGLEQIKDRAFKGAVNAVIEVPDTVKEEGLLAFEGVTVSYAGKMPEKTYETTATRLSNGACRGVEQKGSGSILVSGMEGVEAALTGVDTDYFLTVESTGTDSFADAWRRAMQGEMPTDFTAFEVTLTDESEIPVERLGNQTLSITVPLPETLAGKELQVVTLDRNGQLEGVFAEQVTVNGKEALRIRTNRVSSFGIYSKMNNQ